MKLYFILYAFLVTYTFLSFPEATYLLIKTARMDQRHSSNPSHMYKTDRERMRNHQQHDHQLNLGNLHILMHYYASCFLLSEKLEIVK